MKRFWPLLLLMTTIMAAEAGGPPTASGFRPLVLPLSDLPKNATDVWTIQEGGSRLVVCSTTVGVVELGRLGAKVLPIPAALIKRPMGLTAAGLDPDTGEVVAGGSNYYVIYRDGSWISRPIVGLVRQISRVPDGWCFFTDSVAAYLPDQGDRLQTLAEVRSSLLTWRDGYYVYSERGLLRWTSGGFQPSNALKVSGSVGYSAVHDGELYCTTQQGMLRATDGVVLVPRERFPNLLTGIWVTDRYYIFASYDDGLVGLDRETGAVAWHLTVREIGSGICSLAPVADGAWVGTDQGVIFIPDPDRLLVKRFDDAPSSSLHMASSSRGPVFASYPGGVIEVLSGKQLGAAGTVFAEFEGTAIIAGPRSLEVGGRKFPLELGMVPNDILAANNGIFLASSGTLAKIGLGGRVQAVVSGVDTAPWGMAFDAEGFLLIGTPEGVRRYDSSLNPQDLVFPGAKRVHRLSDGFVLSSPDNEIFDAQGRLIGRIPPGSIEYMVRFQGQLLAVLALTDGQRLIGRVTPTWQPCRISIPEGANLSAMHADGGYLYVTGMNGVARLDRLEPYPAPQLSYEIDAPMVGAERQLRPGQSAITLHFNQSYRPGEIKPSYTVILNNDSPLAVDSTGVITLPRVPWGSSLLRLRENFGGLALDREVLIYRPYPWWLSPWTVAAFGAALGGGLYGIYRWRIRVLRARAVQLEMKIEERTRELTQAKQAREYFISAMSHEIRNPLNGVIGLCEILRESATTAREQSLVSTLQGCADQLRSLLDDVLDWSKIERGEIEVATVPFEARTAVEAACRSMDVSLGNVTLTLPDPCWLAGDVAKIRQIIMNLVGNGLKHGAGAVVAIEAVIERNGPNGTLIVRVGNAGPQYSTEELESFFAEYRRGPAARQRQTAGLGLGLNISRKLAVAMGGALSAASRPGLVEFTLTLPLPLSCAPLEPAPLGGAGGVIRVLAIEDEHYNRLVLGSILERIGCTVDWAQDGANAWERIRCGRYDLILTDYFLPDTTGAILADGFRRELGEHCPAIIAITAYSSPERISEGLAAGIQLFVVKPISLEKIASAITQLSPGRGGDNPPPLARPSSSGEYDFTPILRLKGGRELLADYSSELMPGWADCQPLHGEFAVAAIHKLRSGVLVVRALELAEQLGLLETAATAGDQTTAQQLARVIEPMLRQLADSAFAAASARGEK